MVRLQSDAITCLSGRREPRRTDISLNGQLARPCQRMPTSFANAMIDEQEHVDLLYEEGPVLVVCKPAGLLTQAPPGIDSLEARIKSWIKRRNNKPGNVYLGVPHRLDRPVSGALLFARHVRARDAYPSNSKGAWCGRSIGPASRDRSHPTPAHGPIMCEVPGEPRAGNRGSGSCRRARSGAALSGARQAWLGHLARNRARDRTHASDSRAVWLARPPGVGGYPVRRAQGCSDPRMKTSECGRSPCTAAA